MIQKEENFYNIDDQDSGIFRELGEGLSTRIFPGQQAMVSVVRVAPNAKGAIHSHEQEQWGYLISGSAIRIHDGEEIEVGPGDFWCSPGHVEHGIIGGQDGAVILDVLPRHARNILKPAKGSGSNPFWNIFFQKGFFW